MKVISQVSGPNRGFPKSLYDPPQLTAKLIRLVLMKLRSAFSGKAFHNSAPVLALILMLYPEFYHFSDGFFLKYLRDANF
jgi:hypothetical protein